MQTQKYYIKYTTITQQGKNPRDNNEPWGSLSYFKTQNKPIEDDDQPFDSLSSSTMQEKKTEDDDEVHSSLFFALVS